MNQLNYYISFYQPLIDTCSSPADYFKVYNRIASAIASIVIGRGFNQDFDEYLAANPTKLDFYNWWMDTKNTLAAKANI